MVLAFVGAGAEVDMGGDSVAWRRGGRVVRGVSKCRMSQKNQPRSSDRHRLHRLKIRRYSIEHSKLKFGYKALRREAPA